MCPDDPFPPTHPIRFSQKSCAVSCSYQLAFRFHEAQFFFFIFEMLFLDDLMRCSLFC